MKVQFYKPKNEILQKYMEGYYFILEDNESDSVNYRTFPNNFTIVTVMQNVSLKHSDNKIIVTPSQENNIFSNIVYRYNIPIEIFYQKPLNEITIYFKPMGLNFFIDDVAEFYSKDYKNVIEFDPFADFKTEMEKIFNLSNRER